VASPFHELSRFRLTALADALVSGRLGPPFTAVAVQRVAPGADASGIAAELGRLARHGMRPQELGYLLRAIAREREAGQRIADRIELVWSGPEHTGSASRDTGVVVRELFSGARSTVHIAGFAVHNGRSVFRALADNMAANPSLSVRMFMNIPRPHLETRPADQLVREYVDGFVQNEWPGGRLPELYYDPRALSLEPGPRASLHAKCIVVDRRWSFITSANFTEAAQDRNIEAGVLIDDPHLATAVESQLENLISAGGLRLAPQLA
jgi:phosphatidylserine/phosphatidylglycerophosphate/cardiolipin synthase-like enzyme